MTRRVGVFVLQVLRGAQPMKWDDHWPHRRERTLGVQVLP